MDLKGPHHHEERHGRRTLGTAGEAAVERGEGRGVEGMVGQAVVGGPTGEVVHHRFRLNEVTMQQWIHKASPTLSRVGRSLMLFVCAQQS